MNTQTVIVTGTESERRALAEILRERDKYARRGDVELVGALVFAYCEQGTMDFRQAGPMLARLTDGPDAGQYVFLQPWTGLPDLVTATDELCDQCCVPCKECKGEGKRHCTALRCGGAGKIVTSWQPCPECEDRGKRARDCKTCGGRGQIPYEEYDCPSCKGSGTEVCVACHGTGQMPTGKLDRKPLENPLGACCPACQGSRYKLKVERQDVGKFVRGTLEGYAVLGPITGMALQTLPGADYPASFICDPDMDGNYPAILVERPFAAASGMYLFGGHVRKVQ